jgi:hypothetical protein
MADVLTGPVLARHRRRVHDHQVGGAWTPGAFIGRTCVTGYGEGLVKAALHADEGEIETMAHFRAADHGRPG